MRKIVLSAAALLSLAVPTGAFANMLTNGSLETTAPMNQYGMVFVTPTLNPHAITGWTITAGSVDIVPKSVLKSALGGFSIDMIGTPSLADADGLGSIQQTVTTVADTDYQLAFDFSVNPSHTTPRDEFGDTKILQVQAIGLNGQGVPTVLATQTYSDTAGTRTATDMQWALKTFDFNSDTFSQVEVVLSALKPGSLPTGSTTANIRCGPMVDNLDLEPVGGAVAPEPASISLLGMGSLLLLRRKRRTA